MFPWSCQIEYLPETILRKDLERNPCPPTWRDILHEFSHELKMGLIIGIQFEHVLIYKSFNMEFPQYIFRSSLVKAQESNLFVDLSGWIRLLGLKNGAVAYLDKLVSQD